VDEALIFLQFRSRDVEFARPEAKNRKRGMEQVAFLMRLKPGHEQEYKNRHNEIWPELKTALTEAGVRDYSIFLDQASGNLFAVLRLMSDNKREKLPMLSIVRRWWDYMADLMEVDTTNKPIERPLTCVFHMD
jgi:L-rhamnose mutarotase